MALRHGVAGLRLPAGSRPQNSVAYERIPTAREATTAIVTREDSDSAIISSFARWVSGNVSAGENAVALVKARKR